MSLRIHHGLIAVSFGRGSRQGIYWLRLYELSSGNHLAVLTEVPGNQAESVTNAISRIVGYVVRRFNLDIRTLSVFQIWPRGSQHLVKRSEIDRVLFQASGPRWKNSNRAAIERLLGQPLDVLPAHAELLTSVLALGGGRTREVSRDVYEGLPVKDFPPPHDLFKCRLFEKWVTSNPSGTAPDRDDSNDENENGRRFWEAMTSESVKKCPRHRADWRTIGDASVQILDLVGDRADSEDYIAAANDLHLGPKDKRWLASLFADPIIVIGGGYTNGQHRACALRFSGAHRAAVVVDTESLGEVPDDWEYLGGG
jgi:hypothetical protein